MDELELTVIGAVFAWSVSMCETRIHELLRRAFVNIAVLCATGLALLLLHLSVSHDASDFIAADVGVILVTGAWGVGGLLPWSNPDN